MQKHRAEYERCRAVIDSKLADYFTGDYKYKVLLESMRYSLTDGGKRIRSVMCLKFCEAVCNDMGRALDAACAIEMLHAYSLIHDDLPCMDNDGIRRGKPSNHIEFGEYTAALAGDALQACAFDTLMGASLPPQTVVKMGRILARAAGPHGICGGQFLDLSSAGKKLSKVMLEEIYSLKTSMLISASARLGVVAAGGSSEQEAAAEVYAGAVGTLFQIRDDMLDHYGTTDSIGKPSGSDKRNNKTTFASLIEASEFEQIKTEKIDTATEALRNSLNGNEFLVWLAWHIADRTV